MQVFPNLFGLKHPGQCCPVPESCFGAPANMTPSRFAITEVKSVFFPRLTASAVGSRIAVIRPSRRSRRWALQVSSTGGKVPCGEDPIEESSAGRLPVGLRGTFGIRAKCHHRREKSDMPSPKGGFSPRSGFSTAMHIWNTWETALCEKVFLSGLTYRPPSKA